MYIVRPQKDRADELQAHRLRAYCVRLRKIVPDYFLIAGIAILAPILGSAPRLNVGAI